MRLKLRNKIYKQVKNWKFLDFIPTKLLKSKKKLWKNLFITFSPNKTANLNTYYKLKMGLISPIQQWNFIKKAYKLGLETKRIYYHIFNYTIRNKILKNTYFNEIKKFKNNLFINSSIFLLKAVFRLDILLWLIGFFNSVYEARKYISLNFITLNETRNSNPCYEVKTGDILNFKSYNNLLNFGNILNKKISIRTHYFGFCELDLYTKSLIIITDYTNIIKSYDNSQIFFKKIDIRKFITYLKKEY